MRATAREGWFDLETTQGCYETLDFAVRLSFAGILAAHLSSYGTERFKSRLTRFEQDRGPQNQWLEDGTLTEGEVTKFDVEGVLDMEKTIQQKNKELVLEAFDTLFNKRNYSKAETFWSPNYIQHSAHIEPGREGLPMFGSSFPLYPASENG